MAALRASLRTRVDDAVWDTFSDAYDKAYAYYENDKLEDCIKECSGILGEEASLPRYIRICTLILLALVVKEEVDFHEARTEAGMSPLPTLVSSLLLTIDREPIWHDAFVPSHRRRPGYRRSARQSP
jgi:hypothetical protein